MLVILCKLYFVFILKFWRKFCCKLLNDFKMLSKVNEEIEFWLFFLYIILGYFVIVVEK